MRQSTPLPTRCASKLFVCGPGGALFLMLCAQPLTCSACLLPTCPTPSPANPSNPALPAPRPALQTPQTLPRLPHAHGLALQSSTSWQLDWQHVGRLVEDRRAYGHHDVFYLAALLDPKYYQLFKGTIPKEMLKKATDVLGRIAGDLHRVGIFFVCSLNMGCHPVVFAFQQCFCSSVAGAGRQGVQDVSDHPGSTGVQQGRVQRWPHC